MIVEIYMGFDINIKLSRRSRFSRCHIQPMKRYISTRQKPQQQTTLHTHIFQTPANNCRLYDNVSSETISNEDKKDYEAALKDGRFSATLIFPPHSTKEANRKRSIIWVNQLYDKNLETNLVKMFIKFIHKQIAVIKHTP